MSEVKPAWPSKNVQGLKAAMRNNRNPDAEKCFSWITRNGDELQVSTPPYLRLDDESSYDFINFATILGPARQGKSFLMNRLIDEDAFITSDSIGVCTKGVQVASAVHKVGKRGCALYVDTEGQGDEDTESDTTLLTPVLLLSKVILFNWKGGLQKTQILNELAILVEVGNCVSSNSFGDDAPKFGHLHIVLRDFHFQGTADEAFDIIFDDEDKRGEKARERNKIREKLLSSFESINVSIFPAPSDDVQNLHHGSTICEKFKKSIEQLRNIIQRQMSEPRKFGSTIVNSQNADILVRKFVAELEKGDIVHVKSVVSQLQRGVVDEAKRSFEVSLLEAFGKIRVPVKKDLEELLTQERDAFFDAFEESTAKVDLEAVYRDGVLEDLKIFADRELKAKRRENHLAIQSREVEQKDVLAEAVQQFRSAVENELGRDEAGSRQMRQRFQERKMKLVDDFHKKTDQLDWIAQIVKMELEKIKTWASARLDKQIETKEKEEEYAERSEQQVRLSRAVEDFRSGIENELRKNRETDISSFRRSFHQERDRLVRVFRDSTDGLQRVSQLTREELEKMKNWAAKKLEEKVQFLEEAERLKERERKRESEQAMLRQEEKSSPFPFLRRYVDPFSRSSNLGGQSYPNSYGIPPAFLHGYNDVTPPSSPMASCYEDGPFTTGGDRVRVRDCYISPSDRQSYPTGYSSPTAFLYSNNDATPLSSLELKYYKGGQFTPGGGRAPVGGCYMSPNSSSSRSLGSSLGSFGSSSSSTGSTSSLSSGLKFYKGGQFTPGGGRAPKGGCWK